MKNLTKAIVFILFVNYFQTVLTNQIDQGLRPRRGSCRDLGGLCILRNNPVKPCPVAGYNDTLEGRPWCNKKRKCCFPDPTAMTTTTTVALTCPEEFVLIEDQCFKLFNSSLIQYGLARKKCGKMGHILAEPESKMTIIKLAEYAASFDSSDSAHYWLGARGDGSGLLWKNRNEYLPAGAPWMADQPEGISNKWCLDLRADSDPITRPLATWLCDRTHYYICEAKALVG